METKISKEDIEKYRFPDCFEYFEEAPILQYLSVRISLNLFGPRITRSIAEYFDFSKSKFPIYTDAQIKDMLQRNDAQIPFTPTPRYLVDSIKEPMPKQSIVSILEFLHSEAIENINTYLEDMRIHIIRGNIVRFFKLDEASLHAFTQQFNDIYFAYFNDGENNETIKARFKILCHEHALSPQPKLTLFPSPHSI
jgi:hypothetical protein